MTVKKDHIPSIRKVRVDDAPAVLALHREVIGEGEYFIALPEEYTKTPEQQQESIQAILENEREIMFVAEIDDELAGLIAFSSPTRKRLSHTGSITMMIKNEHRNKGLGTSLLTELLAWAKEHPHIEKVSLGVFSTNHKAIALYKRMGFVEEGRKIKEFKLNDSEYIDDILMYKFV